MRQGAQSLSITTSFLSVPDAQQGDQVIELDQLIQFDIRIIQIREIK
jgi:hypothetical protein